MGHDGTLGASGRAARVHLVEVVVGLDLALGRGCRLGTDPARVAHPACVCRSLETDERLHGLELTPDPVDGVDVLAASDQNPRAGVVRDSAR